MTLPKKVYIDDFGSGFSHGWHTEHCYESDIEYIHKDVFIEKACEWIRENWREYINVDKDGVVCFGHWERDFKKYLEE